AQARAQRRPGVSHLGAPRGDLVEAAGGPPEPLLVEARERRTVGQEDLGAEGGGERVGGAQVPVVHLDRGDERGAHESEAEWTNNPSRERKKLVVQAARRSRAARPASVPRRAPAATSKGEWAPRYPREADRPGERQGEQRQAVRFAGQGGGDAEGGGGVPRGEGEGVRVLDPRRAGAGGRRRARPAAEPLEELRRRYRQAGPEA